MPQFTAEVVIRDDMYAGLMCSDGHLLIGRDAKMPRSRVDALLHHEVGTHLLTYYNGLMEPFKLLHTGLAGYDSLQEGIAVLSEYLVGGLSKPRLRLLAARVWAVHMMLEGATFVDTFRALTKDHGFSQRIAYTVTMRVYRGGGFTKDAVYLRGLVEILDYLGQGGTLEPLFVGKIAERTYSVCPRTAASQGDFAGRAAAALLATPRRGGTPGTTQRRHDRSQSHRRLNFITGTTYANWLRR